MTNTYQPLATFTATTSFSTITFNNVPATFGHLVLVVEGVTSVTEERILLRFNGDTGSNYTNVNMEANQNSLATASSTTTSIFRARLGNNGSMALFDIMDYSATDKHKTVISHSNGLQGNVSANLSVERFASTSAITSITVLTNSGTLNSGAIFSLYGIST